MDTALGLLGLLIFVLCVVALAASITWLVVKADAAVRRARHREAPSTNA